MHSHVRVPQSVDQGIANSSMLFLHMFPEGEFITTMFIRFIELHRQVVVAALTALREFLCVLSIHIHLYNGKTYKMQMFCSLKRNISTFCFPFCFHIYWQNGSQKGHKTKANVILFNKVFHIYTVGIRCFQPLDVFPLTPKVIRSCKIECCVNKMLQIIQNTTFSQALEL